MNTKTMIILLILMLLGYIVITYIKLIKQDTRIKEMRETIKLQKDKSENTDRVRRKHNTMARYFNNTLQTFIGRNIAKKLGYSEVDIIEKT